MLRRSCRFTRSRRGVFLVLDLVEAAGLRQPNFFVLLRRNHEHHLDLHIDFSVLLIFASFLQFIGPFGLDRTEFSVPRIFG